MWSLIPFRWTVCADDQNSPLFWAALVDGWCDLTHFDASETLHMRQRPGTHATWVLGLSCFTMKFMPPYRKKLIRSVQILYNIGISIWCAASLRYLFSLQTPPRILLVRLTDRTPVISEGLFTISFLLSSVKSMLCIFSNVRGVLRHCVPNKELHPLRRFTAILGKRCDHQSHTFCLFYRLTSTPI